MPSSAASFLQFSLAVTGHVNIAAAQLGGLQMPPLASTPPPVQMPPGMKVGGPPGTGATSLQIPQAGGGGGQMAMPRTNVAVGPMLSPTGEPIGGAPMGGGGAPGGGSNLANMVNMGTGSIDPMQKLMNDMMQNPVLDGQVCGPSVNRKSTNIGEDCWSKVWQLVGCKKENTPKYEQWHGAQSLEILAVDALQWANLPSEKHKTACYGDQGPPPPAAPQGLMGSPMPGAGMGGGMQGMPPLGAPGMGGGPGGLPTAGMQQMQQQQQMTPQQQQMEQALAQAVEQLTPQLQQACGLASPQQTDVGADCWSKAWAAVGCLPDRVPPYEQWHSTQSLQVLIADVTQWAALPSEKHRMACYGKMEL